MKIAERNKLVYIMQRQRHLGQCLSIIAAFVFLSSTFRVIWFSVIDGLFFLCVCVLASLQKFSVKLLPLQQHTQHSWGGQCVSKPYPYLVLGREVVSKRPSSQRKQKHNIHEDMSSNSRIKRKLKHTREQVVGEN